MPNVTNNEIHRYKDIYTQLLMTKKIRSLPYKIDSAGLLASCKRKLLIWSAIFL